LGVVTKKLYNHRGPFWRLTTGNTGPNVNVRSPSTSTGLL